MHRRMATVHTDRKIDTDHLLFVYNTRWQSATTTVPDLYKKTYVTKMRPGTCYAKCIQDSSEPTTVVLT